MVLAVDIGGTKLATAVVDDDGRIHASRKDRIEKSSIDKSVKQIYVQASATLQDARMSWGEMSAAGVIVPGTFDKRTGLAWAPNVWGNSCIPLFKELSERLPSQVFVETDRVGYVLGEQWLGAARGLSDVVFVAVGTGIGAGIVSGGQLIRGTGNVAGSVGWLALNPEFQEVYRGFGCWECEASGSALARLGGSTSAEQVAAAARKGETQALEAVAYASRYLAMGIANLVSVLNPQMVVLGGGVMRCGDLFLSRIRQDFPRWAQPEAARQTRIELTTLGELAGLLGAARWALSGGLL
jgi:glucokinase